MRSSIPESESGHDDFEGIIARMAKVGWIKSAAETAEGVAVHWTAVGEVKLREMAKLVQPFADWLVDKRKPKPSNADQVNCVLRLAPYVRELCPPEMDEVESLKLLAFVVQLAPK